jgi:membrane-bound lytic murein transglycosylase A
MPGVPLLLAIALTITLAGCASPSATVTPEPAATLTTPPSSSGASVPPPPVTPPQPAAPAQPAASASPDTPAPKNTATTSPVGPAPGGFATRHAYYEPTRFADLPGWTADDLNASWDAFLRSCSALGKRTGWAEPCAASRAVDSRNAAAVRQFFETWFNAYQIRNTDKSNEGTMTGYYEPLLNGSSQYGGAYIYPVYGTPTDMLYLDARRVPDRARGSTTAARIEGRTVIPLTDVTSANLKGVYELDLRDSVPDIRDKKIRLRLDHDRIVPYYTRAEIEHGALNAQVLAYVDDPVMLYSMQVQGSGKVRMRDGSIRRFAYAEQNGRPFLPPIARNNQTGGRRLVVRGMDMQIDVSDDTTPASVAGTGAGADDDTEARGQAEGDDDAPVSPLLRGFKLAATTPSTSGSVTPAVASGSAGRKTANTAAATGRTAASPAPASTGSPVVQHNFATSDPSYVFFRLIPDSPNGPVGALGVPLSAGRSVAVDPRTTPLGAPVFVATRDDPQAAGAVNRLMFAQDSGGAIQGAVRADYFYGFGQSAQAQASRTKERLRMWVLLPKGLPIAAQDSSLKTRGAGPAVSNADCLVSDPELCVDDAP